MLSIYHFDTFEITLQISVLQVEFLAAKLLKDQMVVIQQMANADAEPQRHALDLCQYVVIKTLHLRFAHVDKQPTDRQLHVASPIQLVDRTEFVL